jgi:hypothetical protein
MDFCYLIIQESYQSIPLNRIQIGVVILFRGPLYSSPMNPLLIVTIYLKSGQTLVIDHVKQFTLQGDTLKWEQEAKITKVYLNHLQLDQLVAFTSERQP